MIDESPESPSDGSVSPMPEFENPHHLQLDPSQGHLTPHPDVVIHPNLLKPLTMHLPRPLFVMDQLGVDRRLLVNRKRQLKMYRVWMQGRFKKQGSIESRKLDSRYENDHSSPWHTYNTHCNKLSIPS